MAYIDQYALSDDVVFRKRVEQSVVTSAVAVSAESRATPPTAQQTRRANLARAVLLDPPAYAVLFAKATAANVAISAQSTDSDILFTTNSLFDAFAGEV